MTFNEQDEQLSVLFPDADGVVKYYSFSLTREELNFLLALSTNKSCKLPSLDGSADLDSSGLMTVQYKNPGGYRFASFNFTDVVLAINKRFEEI